MLLHPYNVKSAELAVPVNQTQYYHDLVGYTEYKTLYDAFIDASAIFAANPTFWTAPSFATEKAEVETIMKALCECKYVKYKLVAQGICRKERYVPVIYGRMLTDVLFLH